MYLTGDSWVAPSPGKVVNGLLPPAWQKSWGSYNFLGVPYFFGDLPSLNSDFSSLSKASWTNNNEIISREPQWIFPEHFATNINQLEISKASEFLLRTCPFISVYFIICLVYMGYFHWHHWYGSPRELFNFLCRFVFSAFLFQFSIVLLLDAWGLFLLLLLCRQCNKTGVLKHTLWMSPAAFPLTFLDSAKQKNPLAPWSGEKWKQRFKER